MRTIHKHTTTKVLTRKELATLVGLEPLTTSKIVVEVHGEEVTVVQQDESADRG